MISPDETLLNLLKGYTPCPNDFILLIGLFVDQM